jgi:hypothetical protein
MSSIFSLNPVSDSGYNFMTLAAPTATATLSVAASFSSLIRGVPTGAATYTTATATEIQAAMGNPRIGDCFEIVVLNASAGANTITLAGGAGVTDSGVMTVAQNASKKFIGRFTAVGASPAITLYGLGSTASAVA